MNQKRTFQLTSKDYLTIGLYSVVCLVLSVILSVATSPFLLWFYPYATAFVLFFTCPIYILMAFKVGKKGVLLTFGIVSGIFYALMGAVFVLPFTLVGGILGEYLLSTVGNYRSLHSQTIAFTVYNVIYGFCNYIIVAFSADYYFSTMHIEGTLRDVYIQYMTSPLWISVAVIALISSVTLGCLFGYKLLQKHFVKAGFVTL